MFSATFQEDIKKLVSKYLNNHVMLLVGKVGSTTDNIVQRFHHCEYRDKYNLLKNELTNDDKTIVFTETKFAADKLELTLYDEGYKVVCTHGNRSQQERDLALALFKSGKANIMVATGVASRGLDIPNVKKVIIFDCPKTVEEYVHRVGRTGRAGNVGEAVTLYCESDTSIASGLVDILEESKQEVPAFLKELSSKGSTFNNHKTYQNYRGRGNRGGQGYRNNRYNNDRSSHW